MLSNQVLGENVSIPAVTWGQFIFTKVGYSEEDEVKKIFNELHPQLVTVIHKWY